MNNPTEPGESQTRPGFRILAGILAVLFLLISLPLALYQALSDQALSETLLDWFMVLGCLAGGVGMAVGAKTGRWFNSPG